MPVRLKNAFGATIAQPCLRECYFLLCEPLVSLRTVVDGRS